jgi:hypothetical protein
MSTGPKQKSTPIGIVQMLQNLSMDQSAGTGPGEDAQKTALAFRRLRFTCHRSLQLPVAAVAERGAGGLFAAAPGQPPRR